MTKTIKFFTDGSHGWLEVSQEELYRVGIAAKISSYSYKKGEMCYLEEDLDAGKYIDKLKEEGTEFEFNEIYEENTPIRNYNQYTP